MSVVPSIGMSGIWTLKPPLDTYLPEQAIYTCKAIRSISEYIEQGTDPYDFIYSPLGIPEEDYNDDYNENVYIVSLQGEEGSWVYIPVTYIDSFPFTAGIVHERKGLVLSFPLLPSETNYDLLIDKAIEYSELILGVTPETSVVSIGHQYILPEDESDLLLEERRLLMSVTNIDKIYIQKLENQVQSLTSMLNQIMTCAAGSCLNYDGVIKFPTFNKGTPGHTGYIDAADIPPSFMVDPLLSDNAIDLFIYGQTELPFGIRRNDGLITGGGHSTLITTTSLPFEPDPTDTDSGIVPVYQNEVQSNVLFPVTAADLSVTNNNETEITFSYGVLVSDIGDTTAFRSMLISGSMTLPEVNIGITKLTVWINSGSIMKNINATELFASRRHFS